MKREKNELQSREVYTIYKYVIMYHINEVEVSLNCAVLLYRLYTAGTTTSGIDRIN